MAETATEGNDLLVIDNQNLSIEQLCAGVEKMTEGATISSDYWTIEPGSKARIVFVEMTTMNKMGSTTGETIPAVKLLLVEDRSLRVNGDAVLSSTLKNAKPGQAFSIECTGKTKSAKGSYKEFVVKVLN